MDRQRDIAESIRRFRADQGMSQRELADEIGVDHSYVSRLESGEHDNPTAGTIERLADALGVSPNELMGWRGNPT